MNAEQFFRAVEQMRNAQNQYFKNRLSQNLEHAKRLEKVIDDEISRVNKILQEREEQRQLNLFDQ